MHPFDSDFRVTPEQKVLFQKQGFVLLPGFANENVVEMLRDRVEFEVRMGLRARRVRASYDFKGDMEPAFQLLERKHMRDALLGLTGRDLFMFAENLFVIHRNDNPGAPWHVGTETFGYHRTEDYGCTLWVALDPVDAKGQGGGIDFVPENVFSGRHIYEYADRALVDAFRKKSKAGVSTTSFEFWDARFGLLDGEPTKSVLNAHGVAYDFKPGDAVFFNKMIIHRSLPLGDGPLRRRRAYNMRFMDLRTRYDMDGMLDRKFPVTEYGGGMVPYKPITQLPMDIAAAGAFDGDVISECGYFEDRDRRTVS